MSEGTSAQRTRDGFHFDDVGPIITAVIAGTFALSVAYEISFAGALGLTLADIPLTLTDVTKNALTWLPYWVIPFVFRFAAGFVEDRVRINRPPPAEPPTVKGCVRVVLWVIEHGAGVLLVGVVVVAVLNMGELMVLLVTMLVFLGWVSFAVWAVRHPKIGAAMSVRNRALTIVVPAATILVLGAGWFSGVDSLLNDRRGTASVHIGAAQETVRVLRLYENGVLALEGRRTTFVPWRAVERLDHDIRQNFWWGAVCQGARCVARTEPYPGNGHVP